LKIEKAPWIKGVAHWRDGETAFISVAFTWRLPEVRQFVDYYRAIGCTRVRLGGPGTFTMRKYIAEHLSDLEFGGSIPDAIVRHNPMATRASYGCPVGCHFCIVPKMDGKTFTLIDDFTPRPILCDDNLSALPMDFQKHIVSRYVKTETPLIDCNSGFEPKTFNEDIFALWKPIIKGPWRFGFDETTEGEEVRRAFKILKDVSPRKKQVYVMIGDEPFDLCMDRIETVIGHRGEPYAQPFIKLNSLTKTPRIRYDWTPQKLQWVQRWTNRHLWRKTKFKDYDPNARTNPRQPAA
jgi:hypothetical protein